MWKSHADELFVLGQMSFHERRVLYVYVFVIYNVVIIYNIFIYDIFK
jgi:hypothetical protein